MRLEPGSVEAVSPTVGDIHRVINAFDDRVSVSIHVYGANIGAVERAVYTADGHENALFPATATVIYLTFGTFHMTKPVFPFRRAELLTALRQQQEVAIIDVRDEALFATGHPLFAVNIPLSKLELELLDRIPQRHTAITLYDNGEGWRRPPLNVSPRWVISRSRYWPMI